MKELLKAVADFQGECPTIKKEKNNDFGKFKYTDLSDVVEVIKPLLQKHGLVYFQLVEGQELITKLFHVESGQMIESKSPLNYSVELRGMNHYQVMGSAISYVRKYALCSLLGIVSDEKSIDELKPESNLPKLQGERFAKALVQIEKGEYTKEKLESSFALTDEQKETLKTIES